MRSQASRIGDPALEASFLERVPENARTLALHRAQGASDAAGRAR